MEFFSQLNIYSTSKLRVLKSSQSLVLIQTQKRRQSKRFPLNYFRLENFNFLRFQYIQGFLIGSYLFIFQFNTQSQKALTQYINYYNSSNIALVQFRVSIRPQRGLGPVYRVFNQFKTTRSFSLILLYISPLFQRDSQRSISILILLSPQEPNSLA